jgi:hypothetical protein
MCGAYGTQRTGEKACNILVGNREGKTPLGRSRRRWEDNIKLDLREITYEDENTDETSGSIRGIEFHDQLLKDYFLRGESWFGLV